MGTSRDSDTNLGLRRSFLIPDYPECALLADRSPARVGHSLIIPRLHTPSFSDAFPDFADCKAVILAVGDRLLARPLWQTGVLFFEHGRKDPLNSGACIEHAHIHAIPASRLDAERIWAKIRQRADAEGYATVDAESCWFANSEYYWFGFLSSPGNLATIGIIATGLHRAGRLLLAETTEAFSCEGELPPRRIECRETVRALLDAGFNLGPGPH